jgi:hypothetical protein
MELTIEARKEIAEKIAAKFGGKVWATGDKVRVYMDKNYASIDADGVDVENVATNYYSSIRDFSVQFADVFAGGFRKRVRVADYVPIVEVAQSEPEIAEEVEMPALTGNQSAQAESIRQNQIVALKTKLAEIRAKHTPAQASTIVSGTAMTNDEALVKAVAQAMDVLRSKTSAEWWLTWGRDMIPASIIKKAANAVITGKILTIGD